MQVGDRDEAKPLASRSATRPGRSGKVYGVGGEGTVAVLVVDVELDDVGRDVVRRASGSAMSRTSAARHVAVARLLEAERPQRRQAAAGRSARCSARPPRRCSGRRSGSSRSSRPRRRRRAVWRRACRNRTSCARCCRGTRRSCRPAAPTPRKNGNALVERIGRFLEAVGIRVPVDERLAAAIERPGLVAQSEIMLRRPAVACAA